MRLAGHGARQQGLAGSRGADEQRALGELCADVGVLFRVVEEVHDLLQGLLGLVLAGDVREGDAGFGLGIELGAGFAEAHGGHPVAAGHLLYHRAVEPRADAENEHHGQYPRQEEAQQRGILRGYLVGVGDVVRRFLQTVDKVQVRENAGLIDHLIAVFVRGDENDLFVFALIRYLLYLAVFDHVEELVVADLGDLALQQ